mmetsp:Transcript_30960/g.58838  ORF Transcript_30960/g.58838 Transcript_30960/m.58838 type:complete len:93 (-) Transcript_30960:69-347(-)
MIFHDNGMTFDRSHPSDLRGSVRYRLVVLMTTHQVLQFGRLYWLENQTRITCLFSNTRSYSLVMDKVQNVMGGRMKLPNIPRFLGSNTESNF